MSLPNLDHYEWSRLNGTIKSWIIESITQNISPHLTNRSIAVKYWFALAKQFATTSHA